MCCNFGYCASLFGLIAQHWKPKYFAGNFDDDVGDGKEKSEETKGREEADERMSGTTVCYDHAQNNEIIRFFLATERSISDSYDPIFDARCDICRQMCIRK